MFRSSGPRSRRPATPPHPAAHDAAHREFSVLQNPRLLLVAADPTAALLDDGRHGRSARQRAEVVEYLRVQGGSVHHPEGLVARHLRLALGAGPEMHRLLRVMEHEGLIERDVRGRRTYAVWLAGAHEARPRSESGDVVDTSAHEPIGFARFAAALLTIVEKRLAAVDPDNRARVEQLENYRVVIEGGLRDYHAATTGRPAAPDANEARTVAELTLERIADLGREFERRTGCPVDHAFTSDEHAILYGALVAAPPTLSPAT